MDPSGSRHEQHETQGPISTPRERNQALGQEIRRKQIIHRFIFSKQIMLSSVKATSETEWELILISENISSYLFDVMLRMR